MRLQTAVPRGRNDRGSVTTWIAIAVGVVALVIGIVALSRSSDSPPPDSVAPRAAPLTPGWSEAKPGKPFIRVNAPALDDNSVILVGRPVGGKETASLGGVNAEKDKFVIRLSKKASKGVKVPWIVIGPAAPASTESADSSGWDSQWTVLIAITLGVLVAAFLAYAVAVRRRSSGSADHGLELTAFLKVAALLTISALAVMVVLLATEEDAQNLTALFTLFGTIAGYLAGTRTTQEGEPGGEEPPAPHPPSDDESDGGGAESTFQQSPPLRAAARSRRGYQSM